MALRCPKCGKEMVRVGKFWICGNHPEPVSVPIEHPFSELCAVLPTPIAFVLDEFFREGNPFVALWRMVDAAEIITRFFTITALSDILRQKGEFPEPVQDALTEKLERPTFGAWKELLAIAIDNLPKERGQTRCFVSELPSFVRDKWLPALGSGEDKPEEKLIALRNLIAHAGRLPDEQAQELLNAHRQRFESLAKELSFLANYDLIACTIACPKERQIVWLKGLPDADGTFPKYDRDRSLSFVLEQGRVYLVHDGKGLDLFPLHAFTAILQWREERYEFEGLGEVAPQIYFRLSERGYLECIPFSTKAVFSHLGEDAYQRFRDIFRLEEWREQRRRKAEAQGIQTLWDEQVRELTEVFVGREEHIRQVKDAIKRTSKGVLWISGKPGIGKSALMAKLMQDYIGQTQHYIVIPYFFRYGQAGCSTMYFLETALKRLQAELNREIEPEPRLPERQQQLVEALEEAVSKTGKKVLFLVDGLDEIYRLEREFLNVPFMTMAVKDRIVWVCAGRSEGDLEEALKNRGAVWVFPDGLPPLDEQAIRAMLIEHLGRLKYALFERDEGERNRFVEAVTRKSEGLPLYVRMVIEDLKAGRLTVRDEEKLPEGLVAYYERLLERLRVSDVGTVLTPLFCLLAWAKEPITEGTMKILLQTHHLAGTPRWGELFRRTLEHGHLMLQQQRTPDDETGWAIYHDSFRQYLLESGTVSVSREWAQERWLEVCKDWKALASQEPSLHRYILRHYAEHLYDKWQMTNEQMTYDALCRLALDSDFKQAQTQHLPDEPNLPLKTVQLALDAAIQLEDAPMMARSLIEHAKRAQIEEETPLQAWRKGHRERALRMATEIVFERDHKLGTLWGLLLAWVAESEGERDWAKRFLDEVRKRWEGAKLTGLADWKGEMAAFLLGELGQIEGAMQVIDKGIEDAEKRAQAFGAIAEEMARARMFDQDLKVAEGIEDAWGRAEALRKIAEEMARARVQEETLWRQALQVAKEIKIAGGRAKALKAIAEGMAKAGMFEQALQVAEGIEDAEKRAKALREIVGEMAKAGMFDQALQVAERIEYEWEHIEALRVITERMAREGLAEQALEVAERIEDEFNQAWVLEGIAEGITKVHMFGQLLKTVERIKNELMRSRPLRAIVERMAKEGMFEQAIKVAERILDTEEMEKALREIAEQMIKAGMFEQALEVAERIGYSENRAKMLKAIAKGMAKEGMIERAIKVAEMVAETNAAIIGIFIFDEEEVLREIAEEIAGDGIFEKALEIGKRIKNANERAKALSSIAERMAKVGMVEQAQEVFEQALRVIESIETAELRAKALEAIAEGMAKARMFEEALKVAERIAEDLWWRAWAMEAIAKEIAGARMFNQALQLAEKIKDAPSRARAFEAIVKEMAEAEMFDQALQVAERMQKIGNAWLRAEALRAIAEGMVKARMVERAKEVFEQALRVIEDIKTANLRAKALIAIAEGIAKAGIIKIALFERAMIVAKGIEEYPTKNPSPTESENALSGIAGWMIKVGMVEQALELVGKIYYQGWQRARALRVIVKGMAKAGMFDQALRAAEGIKDAKERAWVLREIAEEMAKAGMFDQALRAAEGIKDAEERAWALREIAGEMAKVRVFEEALKVAEGIGNASKRTWALEAIAEEMAKAGMFEQALKVAEGIEKEAWALKLIAEEMAKAGEVEGAVSIVERETGMRTEMLPSVLRALAERARKGDGKSKEGFLKLLPFCGWSLEFAYKACGLLAWLYPERGEEIAGVIAATGD
jgi:tetratricopeptide (TPR) repeat protein